MNTPITFTRILFTLTVAEKQVLFLLLAEDGTINRKGDGTADCLDNDLYIGITNADIFQQLKQYVTGDMLEFLHRTYDLPEKKGKLCDLTILFDTPSGETGVQFLYGSLSQGPPPSFSTLVTKAIRLTDSWHINQKIMAKQANKKNKSWWKFW